MYRVYIASPYTKPKGKQEENVNKSFDYANILIDKGFAPYAPLWSHYLHLRNPKDYYTWLKLDMEWLRQCDFLLRLPGESSGADAEEKEATRLGIPICYDIDALCKLTEIMGNA